MTGSAAGRILIDGQDEGSGFAITDGRTLTAGHVVRPLTGKLAGGQQRVAGERPEPAVVCVVDRGEPYPVKAVVEYQPEDAGPIPVTRVEVSTGLDVAVLHLQRPAPAMLSAGQATIGAQWRVETRPRASDPALTGTVSDPHRRLRNQRGEETTLVQLRVEQELGDYQGYSGSPVTSSPESGAPGWVIGVLVEQARWRVSPQLGQSAPVANVLFAAPIEQVVTEFGLTGVTVWEPVGQIPLPVPFEVRRLQLLNQVIGALLADLTQPVPDGRLVGLVGMGGSGKSVLAAAVARDLRVRDAFPDGRFWLELGPHPRLPLLQARLAAALGDSTPITDLPQGRARLSSLLAERRCLLVLDNVWDRTDLSAFAVTGPMGRLLVTTRDAATLPGDTSISLKEFALDAALQLLGGWTATPAGQLPAEARAVARECGYLPLALALCGAMIADGDCSWLGLLDLLHHADLGALRSRLVLYPHRILVVALQASLNTLPQDARDRYMGFAVFNNEGPVPLAALQVLWGLGQPGTAALVSDLAAKSLLRVEASRVSLHDLQMDYLVRFAAADLSALHEQLLAGYAARCSRGWPSGPDDGYFYQHLAGHLAAVGRRDELTGLLTDVEWMRSRLRAGGVTGLLTDYATVPDQPGLGLVQATIRLSAHVLAVDPDQLPAQLAGRTIGRREPALARLHTAARAWAHAPWLCPILPTLAQPGGALRQILTGHTSQINAVAVSADGRTAVSGSLDGTVRVWDLAGTAPPRVLTGHTSGVTGVAVSADGRTAVSGSLDGTVRVWDLAGTAPPRVLTGHTSQINAVAVSADGRTAVSGGDDGTVRVWDLAGTAPPRVLTGHTSPVWEVAVSADGRTAVSGGADGTVRVWDLARTAAPRVLTGHDGWVWGVAVSADGRTAVSGGRHDGTVRVWDLAGTAAPRVLTGHTSGAWGGVDAVAVSADGRTAVSGGSDRTVRVWDLAGTAAPCVLTGHDSGVHAVAVSADGRTAVSGSRDGTVRVWDLAGTAAPPVLTGHDSGVTGVAVSADGRTAVSGGSDGTVRVWDLAGTAAPRVLTGHDKVWGVAVSADGRTAVSGGQDSTVRVWDLAGTAAPRVLTGHDSSQYVGAVAVSADGRTAVSGGSDGTVRVWDLAGTAAPRVLTGHDGNVEAVAVSADGRTAVSGGSDRTVRVWDLAGTAAPRVLTGHTLLVHAVAVSADGRTAVSSGGGNEVRVWDLAGTAAPRVLTGHDGEVHAVAVSADGRTAVSGSLDGTVRMWDLTDDREQARWIADGRITAVAFSTAVTIAGDTTGQVHALQLNVPAVGSA